MNSNNFEGHCKAILGKGPYCFRNANKNNKGSAGLFYRVDCSCGWSHCTYCSSVYSLADKVYHILRATGVVPTLPEIEDFLERYNLKSTLLQRGDHIRSIEEQYRYLDSIMGTNSNIEVTY